MAPSQSRWAAATVGSAARRRAFREAVLAELGERGDRYRERAAVAYRRPDTVDPTGIALDRGLPLSAGAAESVADAFVDRVDRGVGDV
ncbi:hypothetical protein [Halostella litorea]|uniref:hypothetical protein n=1 Tax=Halostella litorea TaxID=2528831 RepID=UPI0010922546|nr:hypothetical protein [Halostella litorea]